MADEENQIPVADEQEPEAPAAPQLEGDEVADSDGGQSAFDMEAFNRRLEEAARETVSRQEFEGVKRQAGQTRELQRKVSDLERQLSERPASGVTREEYDTLVDLLNDLLPDDRREALTRSRQERALEAKLAERERALREELAPKTSEPEPTEGMDPEVVKAVMNRAWFEASQAATQYATARGVVLTQEDFDAAESAGRPDLAVEALIKAIDSRAGSPGAQTPAAPTRQDRVADRKAAASGGDTRGVQKDGSMGKYDLNTLSGIAAARKDGAITSDEWHERYKRINRENGR